MSRMLLWSAGGALLALLAWAPDAGAAQIEVAIDPEASLRALVANLESDIAAVEQTARLLFWSALLVLGLGVAVSVLQLWEGRRIRAALVVIGAAISGVTLMTDVISETNHHELTRTARKARLALDEAKLQLSVLLPPPAELAERREWVERVRPLFQEVVRQLDEPESAPRHVAFGLLARPAYAQATLPDWVAATPARPNTLFAVGIGRAPTLEAAKLLAMENGRELLSEHIDRFFADSAAAPSPEQASLAQFLAQGARLEKSFYRPVGDGGEIEFFGLLAVSTGALDTDLQLFEISANRQVPADVRGILTTAYATSPDYSGRREAVYQASLRQQSSLPPDDLEAFLEARELRKRGGAARALAAFEGITRRHPGFYLGWYNLALALDDLGRIQDAERAYRRAAELEPGLDERDSSLYNSFGWFYYRQQRYADAVRLFERALAIDPEHPRAGRNLEVTRAALRVPR